jgi:hypothetical protein
VGVDRGSDASIAGMSETAPPKQEERRPASYGAVSLQLVGAGLILIGAFIPWVQSHALFLTVPVRGIETDYGRVFPSIALAVFAILAYQWSWGWRKWAHSLILLLGLVAIIVAALYGAQVQQRVRRVADANRDKPGLPLVLSGRAAFSVEFDVGYYATLLGAGSLLAGAVSSLRRSRRGGVTHPAT